APKTGGGQAHVGGLARQRPPADFGKLIADETAKWAKVIKVAGIKPQEPMDSAPSLAFAARISPGSAIYDGGDAAIRSSPAQGVQGAQPGHISRRPNGAAPCPPYCSLTAIRS